MNEFTVERALASIVDSCNSTMEKLWSLKDIDGDQKASELLLSTAAKFANANTIMDLCLKEL